MFNNEAILTQITEILNNQRGHVFRIAALSVRNRIGSPEARAAFHTPDERIILANLWGHDISREPGIRKVTRFSQAIDKYETWIYGESALILMQRAYSMLTDRHQRDIDQVLAAFPNGLRPRGRPRAWSLPD